MTTPEFPDAEKSARAQRCGNARCAGAVVRCRAGRYAIERLRMQAEASLTLTPWASTDPSPAGAATITVCTAGSASPHDRRRVVGAGNRDDNVLRRDAAMVIVDLHRGGQRQDLALAPDSRTRSRPRRRTDRPSRMTRRNSWSPRLALTSAISAASSSARPVVAPVAAAWVIVAVWPASVRSTIGKRHRDGRGQRRGIGLLGEALLRDSRQSPGASLLPLTVMTTSCEATPPWWSSTLPW